MIAFEDEAVESVGKGALLELICPACGALIEAPDMAKMIEFARAHTTDAHNYDIPEQHVVDAVTNGTSEH